MQTQSGATSRHLLSPKETSAKTHISESTLAKWRMLGTGPAFVKVGAKVAYFEDIVDTWLATRVRQSTAEHFARAR